MATIKSIEEKAKAYDEALERAIKLKKDPQSVFYEYSPNEGDTICDYIFPELKESKDERILKNLKAVVKAYDMWAERGLDMNDILAWLEKQGEHAKFRDSIQVGDKVTRNEDGVLVNLSQLNRVAKKDEKQGEKPRYSIGDVLCDKSCTTLNKDAQPNFEIVYIKNGLYICDKGYIPISQQDEYELVAKKIEQKPAWSEEDEAMWTEISDLLWEGYKQSGSKFSWDDIRNWANSKLKSLTPQSTWKPSDEQMDALENAIRCGEEESIGILSLLYNDLKKIREE